MANVFDQAQTSAPLPSGPRAGGPGSGGPGVNGWVQSDHVWGYAGFWWRVLAWAVDSMILSAASLTIRALLGGNPLGMVRTPSPGHLLNVSFATGSSIPADGMRMAQAWPLSDVPAWVPNWAPGWPGLIALLLPIAYYALLESSRWQATIGKRVCRLRVTRLDGSRISLPRAIGRYLGKFVSALILGIGFLMIGWTRRKQGLHDLMADTLVVRLRPPSDLVRFNPPS